jgi:hypothetical protein
LLPPITFGLIPRKSFGIQVGFQVFVGTTSLVSVVEGVKTNKKFVNTYIRNIHRCGAPSKLISDRVQAEVNNKG